MKKKLLFAVLIVGLGLVFSTVFPAGNAFAVNCDKNPSHHQCSGENPSQGNGNKPSDNHETEDGQGDIQGRRPANVGNQRPGFPGSGKSLCPPGHVNGEVDCVETDTPTKEVPGCTDESATNFDSLATVDDGSCVYPLVDKNNVIKTISVSTEVNPSPCSACCQCSAEMTSLLVANYQELTKLGNQMLEKGVFPHESLTFFVSPPPTWCTSLEVEEAYVAYLKVHLAVQAMALQ
jgi:hypothetical protein